MISEVILTFYNTHGAINSERLLIKHDIKVKVMALPACLGAGCGFCLRIALNNLTESKDILIKNKIEMEAVYYKTVKDKKTCYVLAVDLKVFF